MSRLGPLYAAVAIFPLLAAIAALPYVAIQYRRRGTLGIGHIILASAFGLYLVGLAFAVILPLRPVEPGFCDAFGVHARLNPFHIVNEARIERANGGWSAVLGNADVQDLILNVFLFIPLGTFVRHMLKRGFVATVAIGLGVSLLIELTQLTGDWGLYPCAYRFFSTTDLITNTVGAAIGAACAPLLRLVPAQMTLATPTEPQPVTPERRFLAALCNAALVAVTGLALLAMSGLLLEATRGQLFASDSLGAQSLRAVTLVLVPGIVAFLAIPLLWQGRTIGEWAVLLRPAMQGAGAIPPPPAQITTRFLVIQAPMLAAGALGVAGFAPAWILLVLLAAFQAWRLTRAVDLRSGAALKLGIQIVDTR